MSSGGSRLAVRPELRRFVLIPLMNKHAGILSCHMVWDITVRCPLRVAFAPWKQLVGRVCPCSVMGDFFLLLFS